MVAVLGVGLAEIGELDDLSPALVLAPPIVGPIRIESVRADQSVTLRGIVAQRLLRRLLRLE